MLTFDQIKAMEAAIGPEAAKPFIEAFQTSDARVMTSLLAEVSTKVDIAEVKGEISVVKAEMATKTDVALMDARLARLEVMVKVLIGLTAMAVAFFSPVAEKLFSLIR